MRVPRAVALGVALLAACVGGGEALRGQGDPAAVAAVFARTELYFGLATPSGLISEREFDDFVATEITPRFPDGFTVLPGSGQFRGADGRLVVEPARVMILLVPRHDREADAKVEQVRTAYKQRFRQQSVLRTDGTAVVSF